MLTFALLLLLCPDPDAFNPLNERDRTIGDSALVQPAPSNPYPRPTLSRFGPEAIRFSIAPALDRGEMNIVTLTPGISGEAIATLDTVRHAYDAVTHTRFNLVTKRAPGFSFCLQGDCSYAGVARKVHALLFDPAAMPAGDPGVRCLDGPGYLTELHEDGRTYNLAGFCDAKHPNHAVYRLIRQGAGAHWPRLRGEE